MTIRMSVIGAGSWGTTVASLASRNAPTTLWARRADLADEINAHHTNSAYLRGFSLPESLQGTNDMAAAVASADVIVMGVPSHGYRSVLEQAAPFVRPWVPIVSLAKGLEATTLARMSQVTAEVLPGHPVAVLTGPNLAKEILSGQPAASVVATGDATVAAELQRIFSAPGLRVYTNRDLIGCEIAGVVKNVMAIAAGMAGGMGFGENTRATLVTRGLTEMARLGTALGGEALTFAGLAGMGDLIATCSSTQSRNHMVGRALGEGRTIDEVIGDMNMVAEGVKSCRSVLALAQQHGVEMPITEAVVAVCHEGRSAADAVGGLMRRQSKSERAGLGE
jgi:glycerol-3-phosphate dehydrogenase (NAD(P)+)